MSAMSSKQGYQLSPANIEKGAIQDLKIHQVLEFIKSSVLIELFINSRSSLMVNLSYHLFL